LGGGVGWSCVVRSTWWLYDIIKMLIVPSVGLKLIPALEYDAYLRRRKLSTGVVKHVLGIFLTSTKKKSSNQFFLSPSS